MTSPSESRCGCPVVVRRAAYETMEPWPVPGSLEWELLSFDEKQQANLGLSRMVLHPAEYEVCHTHLCPEDLR